MTEVQKQLLQFDNKIRLDYENNKQLSEKRDIILDKLRDSDKLPSFKHFDQGSYAMRTGVEPIDKEYDIDVGIIFNVNKDERKPLELKRMVQDILKNHTNYGAEIKRPCVTVTYMENGERAYHVDLAIYAYEDKSNPNSQLYLAKGKSDASDDAGWEKSDPKELVKYIRDINDADTRRQFQRLARYMKRWKNLKFSSDGHAEPPSIGLTLLLHDCHQYMPDDDLNSMYFATMAILERFKYASQAQNGQWLFRLECPLPLHLRFEDGADIFGKMTDLQMTTFKDRLEQFNTKLLEVMKEKNPAVQCQMLRKVFGDEFPLLDPAEAYQEQKSYIPYSSSSGV